MKKQIILLVTDIVIAALILLGVWIINYKIPQKGTKAVTAVQLQQLQSGVNGPSLLDENGKANTSFYTWDYIRQSHPRTAIGYYEPGHYCLLVVDGRQPSSRGMFPDEMAAFFEKLGCKAAYNLDGGHCSFMTYKDQIVNHPYKPEHRVSDGILKEESGSSEKPEK